MKVPYQTITWTRVTKYSVMVYYCHHPEPLHKSILSSHRISFTHVLRVFPWERLQRSGCQTPPRHTNKVCASMGTDGTAERQHTNALVTPKVQRFLSLSPHSLDTLFMHFQHLPWPSDGCFLCAVSALRLEQRRRRTGPPLSQSEEVDADYAAPEEAFRSC